MQCICSFALGYFFPHKGLWTYNGLLKVVMKGAFLGAKNRSVISCKAKVWSGWLPEEGV